MIQLIIVTSYVGLFADDGYMLLLMMMMDCHQGCDSHLKRVIQLIIVTSFASLLADDGSTSL